MSKENKVLWHMTHLSGGGADEPFRERNTKYCLAVLPRLLITNRITWRAIEIIAFERKDSG
jgi:hypothetical protein